MKDNINIQVQGQHEAETMQEIVLILKNHKMKERKAKLLSEENGIKTYDDFDKDGFYNLETCIYVKGIEDVNVKLFEALSIKYCNRIYLNFEYENNYKDLEISNGASRQMKLSDDDFIR